MTVLMHILTEVLLDSSTLSMMIALRCPKLIWGNVADSDSLCDRHGVE